uniref:Coatomer subunit zeta n=1 Tax=Leersia perrieri TaxID=77586 RepID=A0A0D9WHC8_9ORYZ
MRLVVRLLHLYSSSASPSSRSTSLLPWLVRAFSPNGDPLHPVCSSPPRRSTSRFQMESCPSVKNILLLDSEGKRVAVKYYTDEWPTLSAKLAFEKSVFVKTQKATSGAEAEIVMFDGHIVVYKFIQDLHFFVTGGEEENELILASVLQGFTDAIDIILRNNVDKRTALENLDLILLCLDEIVDGGIVLETEGSVIAEKVSAHGIEGATSLAEQTLVQALTTAREHFTKSLLM